MKNEDVEAMFKLHTPTSSQAVKINKLREAFTELALIVNETVADGREKSVVLSCLQDASMHATRAVFDRPPFIPQQRA